MADFRDNPTFGLPSPTLGMNEGGPPHSTWYRFLARLAQLSAERPMESVAVGGSPFVYTARTIGSAFVSGGNVSGLALGRGGLSLAVPTDIFIPMAANDTLTVTYSVLPDLTFVPSARA